MSVGYKRDDAIYERDVVFLNLDLDECSLGRHVHHCEHNCTNMPGSYYCTCGQGFQLSANRRTCNGKLNTQNISSIIYILYFRRSRRPHLVDNWVVRLFTYVCSRYKSTRSHAEAALFKPRKGIFLICHDNFLGLESSLSWIKLMAHHKAPKPRRSWRDLWRLIQQ
jgi:hypothetical protein